MPMVVLYCEQTIKCLTQSQTVFDIKGTISGCIGLRKIFKNPSKLKKNACQSQHVPFFFQKNKTNTHTHTHTHPHTPHTHTQNEQHTFDRKRLFIRFHSVGPEHRFYPWENFRKF